jgi:hypothetical protein
MACYPLGDKEQIFSRQNPAVISRARRDIGKHRHLVSAIPHNICRIPSRTEGNYGRHESNVTPVGGGRLLLLGP